MNYIRSEWCLALLNSLENSQPAPPILAFLEAWTVFETGDPAKHPTAMYNLLNTERDMPGATNFNSVGVKNYVSFEQGIEANRLALTNGYYPTLVQLFQSNDPAMLVDPHALSLMYSELNIWCGGCNYGQNIYALYVTGNVEATDEFTGEEPAMNIEELAVSEFQPGKTEFGCGPFSVAVCAWGAQPGKAPTNSPGPLSAWAYNEYVKVNGDSGPGNTDGSSVANMRTFIKDTQTWNATSGPPYPLHFWELNTVNVANIQAALLAHYPVIVTVTEASVYDLDLLTCPYWWGASGSHIFTIVGVDSQGNFQVYDTANVERGDGNLQTPKTPLPWPRRYDPKRLQFTGYGAIIQLPWLPSIPSGDPLTWPQQTPPIDYTLQAAETVWNSVIPGLSFESGIAKMWYSDYQKGILHGPPLCPERPYTDLLGNKGVIQIFPGAEARWVNGVGTFHQYT